MRLVRFSSYRSAPAVGLLVDGHLRALADLVPDAPEDMRDVIADWDRIRMAIGGAVTDAGGLRLDQVTLRAPIPRPRARSSRSGSTTPTTSRRRRTPG